MLKFLSIAYLLLSTVNGLSQVPDYFDFVKAESELRLLFDQLYSDSLSEPDPVLSRIREILPEALEKEGGMEFPWNKLDKIGVISSEDGMIRIFTWHVSDDPNNYRYFGYIQVAAKKGKVKVFELVDNQKAQRSVQKLNQSPGDWYGKLYYQIITTKFKRKTYYTLLGKDFNTSRSTIKTIEAVSLQRNKPQFLKELFFNGRDRIDRLVLEYSSQVAISVRYDPGIQMITIDHLVPLHSIYEGNYEFYGPDGSFDGMEFEAGSWIYRQDIDARNID